MYHYVSFYDFKAYDNFIVISLYLSVYPNQYFITDASLI